MLIECKNVCLMYIPTEKRLNVTLGLTGRFQGQNDKVQLIVVNLAPYVFEYVPTSL
eukprot:COSAG01_NODE_508_length_16107_cov_120.001187_12_plen_56_part_00